MASKAQTAKAGKAKAGGGGSGRMIVTAVLLLPVIGVLLPTCVVFAINMAPTIVAYFVDRTREKYLAITVGLLNFVGVLPAEAELWRNGQSFDVGMSIATNSFYWLMSYGAAAVGWGLYLVLPFVFGGYYNITSDTRLAYHLRRQRILNASWGEEVSGEKSE